MSNAVADPPKTDKTPKTEVPAAQKEGGDFWSRNFGAKSKGAPKDEDKKPDAKPDAKADAKDEKDEKKPDAAPTPPKPKAKKEAPPPAPAVDYREMAKSIGEGVGDALTKRDDKAKATAATPDLDGEERKTFELYQRLEKKNPTYAGLGDRFIKALKRGEDYERDWLTKNPGQKFNEDDAEHEAFFSSLGVDVNPADLEALERSEILDEAVTKAEDRISKKYDPELEEFRAEKKVRAAMPAILASRVSAAKEFFGKLGDEFKGVLDAKGQINFDEIDRIQKQDEPKAVAFAAAESVEQFADDLHRLVNQVVKFDEKNSNHSVVAGYVDSLEQRVRSMSDEEQMWDGKRFATAEEWEKIPANQRGRYWKLTEPYIAKCFATEQAERVKNLIESEEQRLEKFAKARGYVRRETQQSANGDSTKPEQNEPKTVETPPSPPGTLEPRMAHSGNQNPTPNGSATRTFWSLFGK